MIWRTWGNRALLRALVVALAVLGTGADALPIPLFASAGPREPEGEWPFSPSQEDERDETPDDASDLAWPMPRFVARNGRSDSSSGLAQRGSLLTAASEPPAGRDLRPGRPRAGHDGPAVPLPITLCRLTC